MIDAITRYLKKTFPSNIGRSERTIRVLCGAVLIAASFMDFVTRDQEFWLVLVGWLALVSGIVSHCPIYGLFGISTAEKE